ncbi:MAG: hypothetical protein INR70_01760 [Parafilimonas terrae]|nr:hypothetical protein [Parafilimonas terrae]
MDRKQAFELVLFIVTVVPLGRSLMPASLRSRGSDRRSSEGRGSVGVSGSEGGSWFGSDHGGCHGGDDGGDGGSCGGGDGGGGGD